MMLRSCHDEIAGAHHIVHDEYDGRAYYSLTCRGIMIRFRFWLDVCLESMRCVSMVFLTGKRCLKHADIGMDDPEGDTLFLICPMNRISMAMEREKKDEVSVKEYSRKAIPALRSCRTTVFLDVNLFPFDRASFMYGKQWLLSGVSMFMKRAG